jgi:hypothetical protein
VTYQQYWPGTASSLVPSGRYCGVLASSAKYISSFAAFANGQGECPTADPTVACHPSIASMQRSPISAGIFDAIDKYRPPKKGHCLMCFASSFLFVCAHSVICSCSWMLFQDSQGQAAVNPRKCILCTAFFTHAGQNSFCEVSSVEGSSDRPSFLAFRIVAAQDRVVRRPATTFKCPIMQFAACIGHFTGFGTLLEGSRPALPLVYFSLGIVGGSVKLLGSQQGR